MPFFSPAPSEDLRRPTRELRSKIARFAAALSLASATLWGALTPQPLAAVTPPAQTSKEGQTYTMRYNNVSAGELVRYISKITGRNFVFTEGDLDFQVSYISDEPESIETILNILIEILRINKLDIHEDGETFLITQTGAISKTARVVGAETPADRSDPGVITKVFKLRLANVDKVAQVLSNLSGPSTKIEKVDGSRCLIAVDTRGNVERIESLIEHIDTDEGTVQLEIYVAKHLSLGSLASMCQEVARPLIGSEQLTIIPNPMTNALFLVASPMAMKKALYILDLIDVRSEGEGSELERLISDQIHPDFNLHKLQYHQGDEILAALKQVGKIIAASDTNDPKLAYCIDTMQWIESTNSLLFSGSPPSIQKLKGLISLLDTPVKQVFIEMLIIETSILNSLNFGVDIGSIVGQNKANVAYSFGRVGSEKSPLPERLGDGIVRNSSGAIISSPANASPNFGLGGLGASVIGNRLIHNGQIFLSLGALTNAVQSDANSQVIMNPRIVTEDNTPCKFFTGQSVRVKTGAIQGTSGSTQAVSQYSTQDIGTTISIQPQISGNNVVTLQIDQELSSSAAVNESDDIKPISNTSTTTTRVHVPDKFFLIVGGQTTHRKKASFSAIPCLGGIPLVGKLFGDTAKEDTKNNLLIFIRPHILDSFQDATDVMARSRNELRTNFKLPKDIEKELYRMLDRGQISEPTPAAS